MAKSTIEKLADAGILRGSDAVRAEQIRAKIATQNSHAKHTRQYAAAKSSRLTEGFNPSDSSADNELSDGLTLMRARSRQLVRDSAFAKRAKQIVQNNVIGGGIGLQSKVKSTRGKLNKRINAAIEEALAEWMKGKNCHIAGKLHFSAIERLLMGEIFEAGEILIRKHYKNTPSGIPITLEIIEPERLANDYTVPGPVVPGATVRMGIECDKYYRPLAYWIYEHHRTETRFGHSTLNLERVPADQIIHLYIVDRWPQTRGEPWMHSTLRKLNDVDGYTEAEIIAARGAASYAGVIESPFNDIGNPAPMGSAVGQELTLEPGTMPRLNPGEKFTGFAPNRPNSGAEPFLRFMLREFAAGTGISYESLSRDYSQSNYSSSRLALLDDRDLWRILQLWFIQSFRMPLYEEWLQAAVFSRVVDVISIADYATDSTKFAKVNFKPRGWSWIDPTKEVSAYKEAVRAGFETTTNVIALTGEGRDIEDVLEERENELEMMAEKGLSFDTDPQQKQETQQQDTQQQDTVEEPEEENTQDNQNRIVRFKA